MIQSIVLLQRSGALFVYRPSSVAVAVDFASGHLVFHQVVKLFRSLVVVTLLRHSGALSMCRLPLAAVAVEFALGCLVVPSNRHSCIWFASLSCRVIWSFCCRCFITAFRHSICINVS